MKRRSFVKQTGALSVAPFLLPKDILSTLGKDYKLGYQLFSVNQDMNDDTLGTLKALKNMGYRDFEVYGFDHEQFTYYGLEPKAFGSMITDLGLSATSGHYPFSPFLTESIDDLKFFVDQCIKGAKVLNTPYITWPWLAPELRTIDNFKLLANRLNLIGEQVTQAGLGFAYHNHGFEFDDHDGDTGYNVILRDTDPDLVKFQIDMYWVMHSSKLTPKEWVEKSPGRYVMWHIKDMDKVTRDYTELGNGSIDYTKVMPDPKRSGLEYFYIEQGGNFAHSPLQSAADSAAYFKRHLAELI